MFENGVGEKKLFALQDIEAKKEAQKEKEIDEQEANASTMHRCRTMLDKDLINTGIYESAGKQSLPLVQLVQQLLRYLLACVALNMQNNAMLRTDTHLFYLIFFFPQEYCLPNNRQVKRCCPAHFKLFRGRTCQQRALGLAGPAAALPEAAG